MGIYRRGFLVSGAVAGLGMAAGARPSAAAPRAPKAELKISSQEGIIPGDKLEEKLDRMEKWGIVGLEVWGGGLPKRVKELQDALKGRPIKISAICAGFDGAFISQDKAARDKAVATTKEILTAAGELGSTGMIVVPAFNGQNPLPNQKGREVLLELLPELGEHALKAGTRLLLEPLNRGEAFFLRQLADGAAICKESKSPGICLMGDFYHMGREEASLMGAFICGGAFLHHVHLATYPTRILPGQEPYDYTDGFRGLKMIGYRDYCSFECGVKGDKEIEIPKSVKFLQEQWKQAKV